MLTVGFLAMSLNLGTRASSPELSDLLARNTSGQLEHDSNLLDRRRDFAPFTLTYGYAVDRPLKSEAEQTALPSKPLSIKCR
jgi:hypothetical protein